MPQIGRELINVNNDDEYYKALKLRQEAPTKNIDTHKDSTVLSSGSTVTVQMEDRNHWMHGMIIKGKSKDHQG